MYMRKVSQEEAREGYLMILKDKLRFFPLEGTEFRMRDEAGLEPPRQVKVESYPCTCQGPDTPHEHYFITWPGLVRGQRVEIARAETNGNLEYRYRVL